MYYWRATRMEDLIELADTMDITDKQEMMDAGFSDPFVALLSSFNNSQQVYTVLRDQEVVCVFGVSRIGHFGCIWMLSTGMRSHKFQMMKWTEMFLEKLGEGCKYIGNRIPTYQRDHIKWLQRLGFQFNYEPEVVNGVEWYTFQRSVTNV